MDNFRTEITIPVSRDSRTFEQRRKDMLKDLEQSCQSQSKIRSSKVTSMHQSMHENNNSFHGPNSDLTINVPSMGKDGSFSDDWDKDVNRWIQDSRAKWNEDMKKMRQSMFALEPVDDFDLDHWRDFGSTMEDPSAMMQRMEKQMESFRQKMGSMSVGSNFSNFGSPSGSHHTSSHSSSSRVVTSKSTSSGSDPRNMLTKSNVVESSKQSLTVDGQTTSSSSHSSSSKTMTGADEMKNNGYANHTPGTLMTSHKNNLTEGVMDFLKDAYELGDDGKVHFKVRFDAKDFSPEDIDVSTVDNKLTVHAKKTGTAHDSTTSREFSRSIELPRSIDHEHFQCHLTEDGVLILDAPVKAPNYQSITFNDKNQLGIRPQSEFDLKLTANDKTVPPPLVIHGRAGPTIMKDGFNGRKLHLEVNIDSAYTAHDLCVRMDENSIIVSGSRIGPTKSKMEFTQKFEIPETIDPLTVTAQLINNTLIL